MPSTFMIILFNFHNNTSKSVYEGCPESIQLRSMKNRGIYGGIFFRTALVLLFPFDGLEFEAQLVGVRTRFENGGLSLNHCFMQSRLEVHYTNSPSHPFSIGVSL